MDIASLFKKAMEGEKPRSMSWPSNVSKETLSELLGRKPGKSMGSESDDFEPIKPVKGYKAVGRGSGGGVWVDARGK